MIELGTIREVSELRSVWAHEAQEFTPWLYDNIGKLSEAIGIDICADERECRVGDFSVDIFATDAGTGKRIIIENQLEATDHDHLGKLITYASGKGADIVVWVVKQAREEHRAAIEWLNNHTDEEVGFFLCEIKLYQIDNSPIAPIFNVIEQPNNWARHMRALSSARTRTILPKIKDMIEWGVVAAGEILVAKNSSEEAVLLENGHVSFHEEEMSIHEWLKRVTGWDTVETYNYAIQKRTGRSLADVRYEYMENNGDDSLL